MMIVVRRFTSSVGGFQVGSPKLPNRLVSAAQIELMNEMEREGMGFCSLQESIDTTTPGGKLVFHIFGALAEFERNLIRERTKAGLDAARARGRKGGRPQGARRQATRCGRRSV